MKAVVCPRSGSPDVLQFKEVEKPKPGDNDILVKVHASSVTRGDVLLRKIPRLVFLPVGILLGFKAQKITGIEFAGVVEDIGKNVERFKKGDHVFGTTTGLIYGGNAEYVCVPETRKLGVVAIKPKNLSFQESAVIPVGSMTALFLLEKAGIKNKPGSQVKKRKVLVYGASGSVGTYAIQIAKHFGAEVTGVCGSRNLDLVKSIGADKVIDYTNEDFIKNGLTYDIILDAVGKISKRLCSRILKENGEYKSVKYPTSEKTEYMVFLRELIETGKMKPVIDRSYPLDRTADAHKYVEEGHKKGNVVITVEHN